MKKFLLSLCACAIIGAVFAQDLKKATLYVPEFDASTMDGVYGTIFGVSANGEYAVGYDDFLKDGECSFMWTRSTGKFEIIPLASQLYDVSNDGVAVGDYWIEIPGRNGAAGTKPGYYKDGEWHSLPTNRSDAMLDEGIYDMNGWAAAISADGKYIAGIIPDEFLYKFFPVLWKWDDELQDYVIENRFEEIIEAIDTMDPPYGWIVKGMSDDGTILTGFSEWSSGARSSAVIINGVEKRLTCLRDPLEVAQETGEDLYMDAEGWAQVSANGQYFAGHYAESANLTGLSGWTWTPDQESVTFTDPYSVLCCVDNNGVAYGSTSHIGAAAQCVNGEMTALSSIYAWEDVPGSSLSTIFAASNDGGVLGGIAIVNFSMGAIQTPAVLVVDGTDGVNTVKGDANEVYMAAGWAFINGNYNNARVYNVQGVLVAEATEGNIDLNQVPAGVYIINVDGKSFKVVK